MTLDVRIANAFLCAVIGPILGLLMRALLRAPAGWRESAASLNRGYWMFAIAYAGPYAFLAALVVREFSIPPNLSGLHAPPSPWQPGREQHWVERFRLPFGLLPQHSRESFTTGNSQFQASERISSYPAQRLGYATHLQSVGVGANRRLPVASGKPVFGERWGIFPN